MFKKINSNRDPDVTVTKEIRKEFGKYFDEAEKRGKGFLTTYPKEVFIGMLAFIAISAIMCFIVFTPNERQKEKMPHFVKGSTEVATSITEGISQTYNASEKVIDLVTLRGQVEEVLKKPKLSHADTVFLEEAIKRFELHQQKPKY